MKIKNFIIMFLVIIIITTSFNCHNAFAVGIVENYINEQSVKEMSDSALEELFGQTGYRVASQEEIDSIRESALKNSPDLVTKYPLLFGTCPDSIPVTDSTYSDYKTYCDQNLDGHTSIYSKIGADVREFINNYINNIPSKEITYDSVSPGVVVSERTYKSNSNTASFDITKSNSDSDWIYPKNKYGTPIAYYEVGSETYNTNKYYWYTSTTLSFYDSNFNELYKGIWDTACNVGFDQTYPGSAASISVTELDNTGKSVGNLTIQNTIDNSADLQDYVPYPTKQSELSDGEKVPDVISFPSKVSEDGTLTPEVTPITFPSTVVAPNQDDEVKIGTSTIKYSKPDVDPVTGNITDTNPNTKTNTGTDTNTDTGTTTGTTTGTDTTTDLNVPVDDVPKLDFKPLMVFTRKFPFCIPWDLWDTYKVFESNSEPFYYKFDEIDVNFGFIGCGTVTAIPQFELNFSDYPKIEEGIKVLKYCELLGFIVFLVLKTRNLIRG